MLRRVMVTTVYGVATTQIFHEMSRRIDQCHFYTEAEALEFYSRYRMLYDASESFSRGQSAALQYYMSRFMYLPNTLIAYITDRKPWHVNQTIQRLVEAASESRTPVTMNESYRSHIEDLDDLAREMYEAKNPELDMVLSEKDRAYLLWNSQKSTGWYEDSDMEPDQREIVDELLNTLGLPAGGWMADVIASNFKIDYHD